MVQLKVNGVWVDWKVGIVLWDGNIYNRGVISPGRLDSFDATRDCYSIEPNYIQLDTHGLTSLATITVVPTISGDELVKNGLNKFYFNGEAYNNANGTQYYVEVAMLVTEIESGTDVVVYPLTKFNNNSDRSHHALNLSYAFAPKKECHYKISFSVKNGSGGWGYLLIHSFGFSSSD